MLLNLFQVNPVTLPNIFITTVGLLLGINTIVECVELLYPCNHELFMCIYITCIYPHEDEHQFNVHVQNLFLRILSIYN